MLVATGTRHVPEEGAVPEGRRLVFLNFIRSVDPAMAAAACRSLTADLFFVPLRRPLSGTNTDGGHCDASSELRIEVSRVCNDGQPDDWGNLEVDGSQVSTRIRVSKRFSASVRSRG